MLSMGAFKNGWAGDDIAQDLTKNIVQEVAKYVRRSERFAARLCAKERDEAIEVLRNFSFAPAFTLLPLHLKQRWHCSGVGQKKSNC